MGSIVDDAAISSKEKSSEEVLIKKKPTVVFVLGGPGGGKSTQCTNIAKEIGFAHLSSGELLRKASRLDPANGPMIEGMLKEGLSVPPDYTMNIIQKAMVESKNDKFLLDGFPRDEEIRAAFEEALNTEPELVLFFDCSEEERERRILSRKQGRIDDNAESVRKRFQYFEEKTLPVVEHYKSKGKVKTIDAGKSMEEVFVIVKSYLTSPNIHSENATEAEAVVEAEAVREVESQTSGTDEVVIEPVTEDESKSSAQSEVLAVAEDDTPASEAEDKAAANVKVSETEVEEPSKFDLERDIMKMKL